MPTVRSEEGAPALGDADAVVYRADALANASEAALVSANPLEDPATLQHPLGVMARGKWRDSLELRNLLPH